MLSALVLPVSVLPVSVLIAAVLALVKRRVETVALRRVTMPLWTSHRTAYYNQSPHAMHC